MAEKLFKEKKGINVFELWKDIQNKLNIIQTDILKEKQSSSKKLLEKYDLIFSKIKKENNEFLFESNIFVVLIKYIMESNDFFEKRLDEEQIDELLLLAYIYEWICLDKNKDITLLGDKSEVLKKLKFASIQSNSSNKKIFENIDIDDITMTVELKRRIKYAAFECYKEMIEYIQSDRKIFLKFLNEKITNKIFNESESYIEIWNKTFRLESNELNYEYSIEDSDEKIIYISVFKNDKKIAFSKFKMFYTHTIQNKQIKATGISKELLLIDFIDYKTQLLCGEILSNCLKIANRVVKNIFLLKLQIENEKYEQDKLNNITSKKVVKIFKMHTKNDDKNLLIKKTLG